MFPISGRFGPAVADFVDAVRGAAQRGDFDGRTLGGDGGPSHAANEGVAGAREAEARLAAENDNVKGFDEPGGTGPAEQSDFLEGELLRARAAGGASTRGVLAVDGPILGRLRDALGSLVAMARDRTINRKVPVDLGEVTAEGAEEIGRLMRDGGAPDTDVTGHRHIVDVFAIRHFFKSHQNAARELPGKTRVGREGSGYWRSFEDGTLYYVEEVRSGRKELAAVTIRKHAWGGGESLPGRSDATGGPQSHARDALPDKAHDEGDATASGDSIAPRPPPETV